MKSKLICLITSCLVISALKSYGQKLTTQGKEFYVSFFRNAGGPSADETQIFLTSSVNTSGTIKNPNTTYSQSFTIAAGTVTKIVVPYDEVCNIASGVISNRGLIITAADTIAAYAFSSEFYTSDATAILPKAALGTDYLAASYVTSGIYTYYPSCFLIEATEDNTKIEITPSFTTDKNELPGVPFIIFLNKGQTYMVNSSNSIDSSDISGSRIRVLNGCKPVAVFSGAQITDVPKGFDAADLLVEQMFPVNTFGKKFITANLKGRNVYRVRVFAAYDNTDIFIDGVLASKINTTKYYEFESRNQPKYITTSNPVQVMMYGTGINYDSKMGPPNEGDPTMITVPPIEQQLTQSVFLSPSSGAIKDHKVTIVCKTIDVSTMFLDGANVSGTFAVVPGNPLYSYASFDIAQGQHSVSNVKGFIAYAYGFGLYQGYGYCIGSSVEKIDTYFTCNNISSIGIPTVDVCRGINTFNIITSGKNSAYSWDFGDGSPLVNTNGSVLKQDHNFNKDGLYLVTLTTVGDVSGDSCSQNTTTISQMYVNVTSTLVPSLTVTASPTSNICKGTVVNFIATPVNEGTTPVYQWKLNGIVVGSNSPTYTNGTLNDNDSISCTVISSLNCAVSTPVGSYVKVKVLPQVAAAITITTPNTTVCGGPITFNSSITQGSQLPHYQWKVNNFNAGADTPVFSYTPNNGDVVSCMLTISNGCGGLNTVESNYVAIKVLNNGSSTAAVSITASQTVICANNNIDFFATPVNGGTTPSYQWKINGVNAGTNSPAFSSATLKDNDVVTCTLTSNEVCIINPVVTSNNIVVKVSPRLTPSLSISSAKTSICNGESLSFTASPVNGGTTPAYQWNLNGINIASSSSYTSSTLKNGDVISCMLTSSEACVTTSVASSNTIKVTVIDIITPQIDITVSQNPVCKNETVTFTASTINEGNSPVYNWMLNNVPVTGNNQITFTTNTLSDGDKIKCNLVSSIACSTPATSQEIAMKINPLPTINFNPSKVIIPFGTTFQLNPVVTGNISEYKWTPPQTLNSTVIDKPVTNTLENMIFELTVTTTDDCKASAVMEVDVFRDLIMPTAFTPNNDGKNDKFRIPPSLKTMTIHYFRVFNKWGNMVFETNDIRQGWDGQYNGRLQDGGVYVWMIEYFDPIAQQYKLGKGTVVLIK